jgi:hypothetical protein
VKEQCVECVECVTQAGWAALSGVDQTYLPIRRPRHVRFDQRCNRVQPLCRRCRLPSAVCRLSYTRRGRISLTCSPVRLTFSLHPPCPTPLVTAATTAARAMSSKAPTMPRPTLRPLAVPTATPVTKIATTTATTATTATPATIATIATTAPPRTTRAAPLPNNTPLAPVRQHGRPHPRSRMRPAQRAIRPLTHVVLSTRTASSTPLTHRPRPSPRLRLTTLSAASSLSQTPILRPVAAVSLNGATCHTCRRTSTRHM